MRNWRPPPLMAVHDYVDLLQKGRELVPLVLFDEGQGGDETFDSENYTTSEWGAGCAEAVLVLVPSTHSVRDILSWELPKFARFPTRRADYDWTNASFGGAKGYSQARVQNPIIDGKYWDTWWTGAVWSSPSLPGVWIVNFQPAGYDVFVRGTVSAERVPWAYYYILCRRRKAELPQTKAEALRLLRQCDTERLEAYDAYQLAVRRARVRDRAARLAAGPLATRRETVPAVEITTWREASATDMHASIYIPADDPIWEAIGI